MAKTVRKQRPARVQYVSQFLIVLPDTDPLVWRRIQVPETYSFWDMHVAIQDAMGWLDYHLHEFEFLDPRTGRRVRIGIPDEDLPEERPCKASWKVPIARYLSFDSGPVKYLYDFGDDWKHVLAFETMVAADGGAYPRCLAGAGACPPEDVGGTDRYAEFLRAIRDPDQEEHEELVRWAGEEFDPHRFDSGAVTFDDPKERFRIAFEDDGV